MIRQGSRVHAVLPRGALVVAVAALLLAAPSEADTASRTRFDRGAEGAEVGGRIAGYDGASCLVGARAMRNPGSQTLPVKPHDMKPCGHDGASDGPSGHDGEGPARHRFAGGPERHHRRSQAETRTHGIKLPGQRLAARDLDRQVAESQVRAAVQNGFTALGIPVSEAVG